MLKSTAGGGGTGMQLVRQEPALAEGFDAVERIATQHFSRGGMCLEKYIESARHIEVQIFGDGAGNVMALGERDCSAQRRNQKLIEETPAPGLSEVLRQRLFASAIRLGEAVDYQSAGTGGFPFPGRPEGIYFLEVQTRPQVGPWITHDAHRAALPCLYA